MNKCMKLLMAATLLIVSTHLVAMQKKNIIGRSEKNELFAAAQHGNNEKVKALLGMGQFPLEDLNKALWIAAVQGHENICLELIAQGAQREFLNHWGCIGRLPRDNNDGITPLIGAATHNNVQMVRFLIANGANPNVRDPDGDTALMTAARLGSEEAAEAILTTIPFDERKYIENTFPAFARRVSIKPGFFSRDTHSLFKKEIIAQLVERQMKRVEHLLLLRNNDERTAYEVGMDYDRGYRPVPSPTTQLVDPNNPQTRAWLRRELERNIYEILFSKPKKKE